MDNARIADRRDAFAALLELSDANPYTIRAYRRAAEMIRAAPVPVAELVAAGRVRDLRGIGPSIEARLRELVEARGGDAEDTFAALMHDATEAYLGDMPHPLKHRSPLGAAFKAAEDHLERALREHFRIKPGVLEIKRADRALLATERRAFSAETWHWPELEGVEPIEFELHAWPPDEAAEAFAQRYAELEAKR